MRFCLSVCLCVCLFVLYTNLQFWADRHKAWHEASLGHWAEQGQVGDSHNAPQGELVLVSLSTGRLNISCVMLIPLLNPACYLAIISSACSLSLFNCTFSITLLAWLIKLFVL